MSVDPRPLRADSARNFEDLLMFAEPDRLVADVPHSVVDSRSAVLRTLGVPAGDAVVTGNCPPVGNPLRTREQLRNCPRGRTLMAILSLPRRDGAPRLADSGRVGGRGERSYRFIRALEMEADSRGRFTLVVNYLLAWSGKRWEVVKRDVVAVLE